MSGVEKTLNVFRKTENSRSSVLALIASDALEYPQAIMECMSQYMDVGIVPVHELSIHPDLLCLLNHGYFLLRELLSTGHHLF
jgi:hypothetical protein